MKKAIFSIDSYEAVKISELLSSNKNLLKHEQVFLDAMVQAFVRSSLITSKQKKYINALLKKSLPKKTITKHRNNRSFHKRNAEQPKFGMFGPPPGTIFYSGDEPPWG